MNVFEAVEYMFGPMRSSTDEENKLKREILCKNSRPIGYNVFDDIVDIREKVS